MLRRPGIQGRAGEFRPIVQDQAFGQRAGQKQAIENPAHSRLANGDIDFKQESR